MCKFKAWYCTISLLRLGVFKGGKLGLTLYKNCWFLLLLLFFFFAILKIHNWISYQQLVFIIWRGCRLLWEILILASVYDKQRTVGLKCFPYKWKKHPCTGSWFYCSLFSLGRNLVYHFRQALLFSARRIKTLFFSLLLKCQLTVHGQLHKLSGGKEILDAFM